MSSITGLMWTVGQQPVCMEQWREHSDLMAEPEEMKMLESVLLPQLDLRRNVLEPCPTAGVQDKGIPVRNGGNPEIKN